MAHGQLLTTWRSTTTGWVTAIARWERSTSFHDNTMYSCGPFSAAANSVHNNVFENNADPPQGTLMYNNLSSNAGALGYATVSQLAPNSGVTSYFFNNVTENYLGGQTGGQLAFSCSTPSGGGGGLCVLFNNTMECGPDSGPNSPPSLACAVAGAAPLTMDSFYNHFITSSSSVIQCYQNACGTVTQLPSPNLAQSLSAANNQGYSIGNNFAPQNGSGATIQAGFSPTALLAQCAAVGAVNASAATACQSSTTAGVTLVTSPYYSIGGPTVTPVARLISGNTKNDAGAYQFGGASATTRTAAPKWSHGNGELRIVSGNTVFRRRRRNPRLGISPPSAPSVMTLNSPGCALVTKSWFPEQAENQKKRLEIPRAVVLVRASRFIAPAKRKIGEQCVSACFLTRT